jgi:hypothetical protein
MYADGDIGDKNHESYVIEACLGDVLSQFNIHNDCEQASMEEYEEAILDQIAEDKGIERNSEEYDDLLVNDPANAIINYLNEQGNKKWDDIVMFAYGANRDAREYAIKEWDWSRVAGDSIETRELTRDKLKVLARGINNVLNEEGKDYEYEDNLDVLELHEYNISTYTGKRYSITLRDMESGNVEGLERADIEAPVSAATQQVRKMDIDAMPDYYKQKGLMGDSYTTKYLETL